MGEGAKEKRELGQPETVGDGLLARFWDKGLQVRRARRTAKRNSAANHHNKNGTTRVWEWGNMML